MLRIQTYNKYKDVINKHGLKQQLFLEKYVNDVDEVDRLLVYHGIGTGKTRTSILICEALMKKNPKYKVNVILPARLKTNYIDELIILFGMKSNMVPSLHAISTQISFSFNFLTSKIELTILCNSFFML